MTYRNMDKLCNNLIMHTCRYLFVFSKIIQSEDKTCFEYFFKTKDKIVNYNYPPNSSS